MVALVFDLVLTENNTTVTTHSLLARVHVLLPNHTFPTLHTSCIRVSNCLGWVKRLAFLSRVVISKVYTISGDFQSPNSFMSLLNLTGFERK